MRTDDYLSDFARLGLQPGCSLETLERTWRRAVSDLHPDRAQDGLDLATRTRLMHELTAAYRRLRNFEREHGRLPGGAVPAAPPPAFALATTPAYPDTESDDEVAEQATDAASQLPPYSQPSARGSGFWLIPVGALGAALWFSGLLGPDPNEVPAFAGPSPTASSVATTPTGSASVPGQNRRIRIGSSEAQVERMMGAPLISDPELWEYGPSHVRFKRGRVTGWYSSPLKPLPVDQDSR
jgi:hypothetical protein